MAQQIRAGTYHYLEAVLVSVEGRRPLPGVEVELKLEAAEKEWRCRLWWNGPDGGYAGWFREQQRKPFQTELAGVILTAASRGESGVEIPVLIHESLAALFKQADRHAPEQRRYFEVRFAPDYVFPACLSSRARLRL